MNDAIIFSVVDWVAEVVHGQGRPSSFVGISPLFQLLHVQVLVGRDILLQALEGTVVLLVEAPVLAVLHPVNVQFISDGVVRPESSLQHGCVNQIELEVVLLQNSSCFTSLINTVLGQWHILPPCEPVELIVGRLAMTYEDDLVPP